MTAQFIRNLTSRSRNARADMQLGVTLAFIAGAINAGGYLAVRYYTSHMTGIVSSIADAIALHEWDMARMAASFLFSFLIGAIISCLIINFARARGLSSEFAFALMLEAVLLLLFGLSASRWDGLTFPVEMTICLLCFIMGLQNALITKISNAVVRTTHVTGIVTDIGIEIGRYIYSGLSHSPTVTPRPEKLKLHSYLLMAFLIGGIGGAIAFNAAGFVMTVPLAFLLAILAGVPLADDFRLRNRLK